MPLYGLFSVAINGIHGVGIHQLGVDEYCWHWCLSFLIPASAIEGVNQPSRQFLWSSRGDDFRGAKLSWEKVCKPRSKGGLSVGDLGQRNKVCLFKHIWLLPTRAGSLLVAWIHR